MIFDMTKRKGGSGGPSKVTQIDVTAVTTGVTISVPCEIPSNHAVAVTIDSIPEPDTTLYWGLVWCTSTVATPVMVRGITGSSILRPNGTYGTDSVWCSFSSSGGMEIGKGPYGKCKAGSTYHIVIADLGVE